MNTLRNTITLWACFAAAAAQAGADMHGPVQITTDNHARTIVSGSFYDTRYSANNSEFLVCTVSASLAAANATTSANWVACSAMNAAGATYGCTLVNPPQSVIDALAGLRDFSGLQFWGNPTGQCLGVNVDNGSAY